MNWLKRSFVDLLLILLTITPLLISSAVLFLIDPPVWPDEPVFYDMARNLLLNGKTSMEIYSGTSANITQTGLGYPPLYFYLLGQWTSFFSSSVESIRLLSLVLGIFCLIAFYFLLKQLFNKKSAAFLGTLLLSVNILFSRSSRIARMEILVTFFLFTSLLALVIASKQKKGIYFLIAGLLAAGAILTHPIGAIVPVIMTLYIIFSSSTLREKFVRLLLSILPVAIMLFWWLLSFFPDLNLLISTYFAHLEDKAPKLPFAVVLFNKDFSWRILFLLYILIFSLFLPLAYQVRNKFMEWKLILIGLVISTGAFLLAKEGCYMLYLQPFIILATVSLFVFRKQFSSDSLRLIITLCVVAYLIIQINIQFFNNDNIAITRTNIKSVGQSRSYNYHAFSQSIIEQLPLHQATTLFIASVPDPYFDLKKNSSFKFYEAADPSFPISKEAYKTILDQSDYIMLTWLPHKFLEEYIKNNASEFIQVGQNDGYAGTLVKLKPKTNRI